MPGQAKPTGDSTFHSTSVQRAVASSFSVDVTLGGIAGAVYSACLLCCPTMNSVASMIFTSSHRDRFWT